MAVAVPDARFNNRVRADPYAPSSMEHLFVKGADAMDVFSQSVVLFESCEDDEALRVECTATAEGGLAILQECAGPLAEWCFDESPHRIEVSVEPVHARALMGHFSVDEPWQLPLALRATFSGSDCCLRIRRLMRYLELPCEVVEVPIER